MEKLAEQPYQATVASSELETVVGIVTNVEITVHVLYKTRTDGPNRAFNVAGILGPSWSNNYEKVHATFIMH